MRIWREQTHTHTPTHSADTFSIEYDNRAHFNFQTGRTLTQNNNNNNSMTLLASTLAFAGFVFFFFFTFAFSSRWSAVFENLLLFRCPDGSFFLLYIKKKDRLVRPSCHSSGLSERLPRSCAYFFHPSLISISISCATVTLVYRP